ncbi:MAG: hypothetical protein JWM58_3977 [Rhizobium sp.]|nr:hypothetical protein [Rhizobium sp.]
METAEDKYDLDRFKAAQAPIYAQALGELQAGRKRSHWMWFVFPQLRGLGSSQMAIRYGIGSIEEARAYLADDVLGSRLRQCSEAMLSLGQTNATLVLGSPDDRKFKSSMTLFDAIEPGTIFGHALDQYFGGGRDAATLRLLENPPTAR